MIAGRCKHLDFTDRFAQRAEPSCVWLTTCDISADNSGRECARSISSSSFWLRIWAIVAVPDWKQEI